MNIKKKSSFYFFFLIINFYRPHPFRILNPFSFFYLWLLYSSLAVYSLELFYGQFAHNRFPTKSISALDLECDWTGSQRIGFLLVQNRGRETIDSKVFDIAILAREGIIIPPFFIYGATALFYFLLLLSHFKR